MKNEGWSALAQAVDRFLVVRAYRQERAELARNIDRKFAEENKQRQFENDLEERKFRVHAENARVQREADQALAALRNEQVKGEQFENANAPILLEDERAKTRSEIDENKAQAGASRASAGAAGALQKQRENEIIYDDPAFKLAMEALGVQYEGSKGGASAGRENINNQLWEAAGDEVPEGLEGPALNDARMSSYQRLRAGAYPDMGARPSGPPAFNPAQMDSSIARIRALTGAIRGGQPYVDPFKATAPAKGASFGDVRGGGSTAVQPRRQAAPSLAPPDPVDSYIQEKSTDPDFKQWYDSGDPATRRKEISDYLSRKGQ